MNSIPPEVWTRLPSERPQGEALWARLAKPSVTERLIAAIDEGCQRHFLVRLSSAEDDLHDTQSRGLTVVTRELAIPEHEPGRYLDIACNDAVGHVVFDFIGGELAERLATGRETAPEAVSRVLAKWRRFWGQSQMGILTHEQQIGLFGELWFLSVWLIPKMGPKIAVEGWRGPLGSRHDFEWQCRSVEVKSSTSTRGRIHHISGLDQLAPPDHGELLLFSVRLREERGATNNLPALIAKCRKALEQEEDLLCVFENTLAHAGYSQYHEDEYEKLKLRVIEDGLFRVDEDFPRLTAASFPAGVPDGIESVEYIINLSGLGHLMFSTIDWQ